MQISNYKSNNANYNGFIYKNIKNKLKMLVILQYAKNE